MTSRKSTRSKSDYCKSFQLDTTSEYSKVIEKLVKEAFENLSSEFSSEIDSLKAEIIELKNSQEFICSKYENLKSEYAEQLKINKKQHDEISQLKSATKEVSELSKSESEKLDSLEQYGRRLNLEIIGVPVSAQEDTNAIVIEVAKNVGVDISSEDISISHRVPSISKPNDSKSSDRPPAIIARFMNRSVRNRLYKNRKLTRDIDPNKFSVPGLKYVFINENLTQKRKNLFWQAKQRVKKFNYKFIWTTNGNLYVRKDDDSKQIPIKNMDDLNLIG